MWRIPLVVDRLRTGFTNGFPHLYQFIAMNNINRWVFKIYIYGFSINGGTPSFHPFCLYMGFPISSQRFFHCLTANCCLIIPSAARPHQDTSGAQMLMLILVTVVWKITQGLSHSYPFRKPTYVSFISREYRLWRVQIASKLLGSRKKQIWKEPNKTNDKQLHAVSDIRRSVTLPNLYFEKLYIEMLSDFCVLNPNTLNSATEIVSFLRKCTYIIQQHYNSLERCPIRSWAILVWIDDHLPMWITCPNFDYEYYGTDCCSNFLVYIAHIVILEWVQNMELWWMFKTSLHGKMIESPMNILKLY
jgi:hypothetical protein